jgi:hypothetical protein
MHSLSEDNEAQPITTFNLNASDVRFAREDGMAVINSRLLALIRMGKALTRKNSEFFKTGKRVLGPLS